MRLHCAAIATCILTLFAVRPAPVWAANTATTLLTSGADTEKKVLVVIGDGYQSTDQDAFNAHVENVILNGTFGEGPLWENMNAFNIVRVNADSVDHGVTQVQSPINEAMTPDAPADGSKLTFTFAPVAKRPVLTGLTITDPSGRAITDHGGTPDQLWDDSNPAFVTGTIDPTTGVAQLTYAAGNAPPAGTFNIRYAGITVARNTALDYRYSGDWNRCYFDWGPNTWNNLTTILDALVPKRDYVIIILNEPGWGGCGGGGMLTVTLAGDWSVPAHESGHMVGGLCDEYGGAGAYTDGEPGCPNMTIDTNRSTLKWRDFVNPKTALPTTFDAGTMDSAETTGLFEGGLYKTTGVYRPQYNDRMNSNSPAFGPVNYEQMKTVLATTAQHNFANTVVGDFDGDGRADLAIHNANALELYLSDGTHEVPRWIQTLPLAGWDYFAEHDQFLVADFDGNGRDDLIVYNMVDFAIPYLALLRSVDPPGVGFTVTVRYDAVLPGWRMTAGDRFYVGDFDGDGRADLYVANTNLSDWSIGYLGMLRSTGTGLTMVRRYDNTLPGWDKMNPGDNFYVANVDGTGGKDLYVSNTTDWCAGYLATLLSSGVDLAMGSRYDQTIPGWANLLPGDQFVVGDLEGDGREDLYAFNGSNWPQPYFGVIDSQPGGTLAVPILHEGAVEGWGAMATHDTFLAANVDGQGGKDVFVYNMVDWGPKYVGRLAAHADGFRGNYQVNTVGKWNLAAADVFLVGNVDGRPGGAAPLDDLVVHNDASAHNELLGLLVNGSVTLDGPVVYYKWIHHYLYHASGYW